MPQRRQDQGGHVQKKKAKAIAITVITVIGMSFLLPAGTGSATPPTFNLMDMQNSMARGNVPDAFRVKSPKGPNDPRWPPPLVDLKTRGPVDFFTVRLRLRPGVHTGWHYHRGFVLSIVEQGTVTEYDSDCQRRTYSGTRSGPTSTGNGFVDPGKVHILKNEGTTDVVLALFTVIPEGAPPFESSPPAPCPVPVL